MQHKVIFTELGSPELVNYPKNSYLKLANRDRDHLWSGATLAS